MHRSVNGIGDEVLALAAIDVGDRLERVVRVDGDEGAHGERVVVLLSEQEQVGLVVVHGKHVIAYAAVYRRGEAHAVA